MSASTEKQQFSYSGIYDHSSGCLRLMKVSATQGKMCLAIYTNIIVFLFFKFFILHLFIDIHYSFKLFILHSVAIFDLSILPVSEQPEELKSFWQVRNDIVQKCSDDPFLFSSAKTSLFSDWCNQKDLQILFCSQPGYLMQIFNKQHLYLHHPKEHRLTFL